MEEKVSVIMPNFNCGSFLEKTINSVINQTYKNWELLVVDDCSTDDSVEVIKKLQASDDRIKLFINEKNSGCAAARNRALREATGKWIAFLDSDDLWTPDKLEKQINFMTDNGYKFSFTKYEHIDEQSKPLNRVVTGPKKVSKRKMFHYCYLGCLTVMYDAESVGLIQIDNGIQKRNDYAMWLKVSKHATAYYLNDVLAYYRKRCGSISHQSKLSLIKYHYRLFRLSENMCKFKAFCCTINNLFYGFWKKVIYVKKVRNKK